MRTSLFRSLLVLAVAFFGLLPMSGCKDDPIDPPDTKPPVVTDTSSLVLTTETPDTVVTSTGEAFSMSFLAKKGGKTTDSVYISFYDPILKKQVYLGPSGASGSIIFFDTIPQQGIGLNQVFTFVIIATKGTQHDTITRYVNLVIDPTPLVLTVTTPQADTVYVKHGDPVTFSFLVTHKGNPEDSSYVSFVNPLVTGTPIGLRFGPSIGGTGELTRTDNIGADVPAGPYALAFTADRRNRVNSNSVTKIVIVYGADSVLMGVRANALSESSLHVTWKSPATDKGVDTVVVMDGNTVVTRVTAPTNKGGASATITGLKTGVTYSVAVHTAGAYSETIQWATALRYGPIRLYANTDPDPSHPSGLVLATQATEHTVSKSDIVLMYDASAASTITLGTASGNTTRFGDGIVITAGTLDNISFGSDLSKKFDSTFSSYQIPDGDHSNVIIPVLTADNHYALVQITTQTDGTLFGTSGVYSYVDLYVSYQPTAGLPYASPVPQKRGSSKARMGWQK